VIQFICPRCKQAPLVERVVSGAECGPDGAIAEFACAECAHAVPVVRGVARFVTDDEYAGSFGFQWNRFRQTQLDSYTGIPLSRNRLFHVTDWPTRMEGQVVLEAGSGAGRFTEVLASTGAAVWTFDLSAAVDANYANQGHQSNVTIFQGSIYEIPFPPASFDKVICLGVLQHTPDPDKSFASLARMVKPGGELAVDVYSNRLASVLSWKYILRPITTRVPQEKLFQWVVRLVDLLLPCAVFVRRIGGRFGARMIPILQYSHWGLPPELNRQWAILDTFDMYSPAHDHPRSEAQVRKWFEDAGFVQIVAGPGPNGVIGRGRRPA
jgi:2-polyprenyl-3-methyl-5-hydroxy-6-metoxy-1,4-benzoquinol methylase